MTTSANYRRTVLRLADEALRGFGGAECDRERAARLLRDWPCSVLLDADLKNELLDRFPSAEPPSVPGLDWLPAVEADAAVLVAEAVAEDCGCRPNGAGLHLKTCPVWVNVGPSLAKREYVRRDSLVAEAVAVLAEPSGELDFPAFATAVRVREYHANGYHGECDKNVCQARVDDALYPLVEVPAPVKAVRRG